VRGWLKGSPPPLPLAYQWRRKKTAKWRGRVQPSNSRSAKPGSWGAGTRRGDGEEEESREEEAGQRREDRIRKGVPRTGQERNR